MTEKHKNAIRRGIKRMKRRRNLSLGMKASWARRRAEANSTDAPKMLTHIYTDDDLLAVAITLVGRENVRTLLTKAIKNSLV